LGDWRFKRLLKHFNKLFSMCNGGVACRCCQGGPAPKPFLQEQRSMPRPPATKTPRETPRARRRPASPLPEPIARERAAVLSALGAVVPMLGTMVGAHVEVVLHDLTQPERSVLHIANGQVTGRGPGSAVVSGPGNDKALSILAAGLGPAEAGAHLPVFPYPTVARDGRHLQSGSVMFRDASGCTYAALCVNADFNDIEAARSMLQRLLPRRSVASQPLKAAAPDMEALMREIIDDAVRRLGKPASRMNKDEKTAAVQTMFERGLFIVKGGVERAAAALGVTRFTVYNYLDSIRSQRAPDGR
jgi:predicted transcriptional regulator YheO